MRRNKLIGGLCILIGFIVLFYKRSGFYGWGGYVDKTLENILLSSIFIIIGAVFLKKRRIS